MTVKVIDHHIHSRGQTYLSSLLFRYAYLCNRGQTYLGSLVVARVLVKIHINSLKCTQYKLYATRTYCQ
jgi:hypothetical protein